MKRKHKPRVKEELIKSQNAIREKYKKLKTDDAANTEYLHSSLKPIIDPLHSIIRSQRAVENTANLVNATSKINEDEPFEESMEQETSEMKDESLDQTSDEQKTNQKETDIDPVLLKYFQLHLDPQNLSSLDKSYGIRSDGKRWLLGDSSVKVKHDKLLIKDNVYKGTKGLYELLFLKNPDPTIFTSNDLATYKEMLLRTNAHKQGFDQSRKINSNKGTKYNNIIKDLLSKTGTGVNLNSVRYEYWDDPNELVDRLRLLVASKQAGNNSVGNEILSIIEELREAGIIE
jgi:hypothetical protein